MAELTVLHFTDLGEEYDRLAVLTDFVQQQKGQIDAVFFTGDFLEGNPQEEREVTANRLQQKIMEYVVTDEFKAAHQSLLQFMQKYASPGQFNPEQLKEEEKKEFQKLMEQRNTLLVEKVRENKVELKRDLVGMVQDSYKRLATEFQKFPCPVYATMGNHDLTLGYDQFDSKKVVFVDKAPENTLVVDETTVIIGRNGTPFRIKGDLNTWEVPPFYAHPSTSITLEDYFMNYSSGYSASFIDQSIEQAQKDEEKNSWRQRGGEMREYQREQRQRLGSPQDVDIYLTHKLPHNNEGRTDVYGCVTGDIAVEYSASAQAVYGGHFHDGQIGKHSNLEKWLAEVIPKSTASESVEGVEVPVIHLAADEPWELNPGTEYFTLTEYNAQKQVEAVTIYEFVRE